jgi:cytoskeletal protein CcmA (bactofilin family)
MSFFCRTAADKNCQAPAQDFAGQGMEAMATSDTSGFAGKSAMQPGTGAGAGRAPVLPTQPPIQPPRAGEIGRSSVERPAPQTAEHMAALSSRPSEAEHRTLIVGREIGLSGEITSCDRLVVEGSVQANLANCRYIDIAESGLYKGSASIDDAEIRGRFEGTLIARKRLHVRATGRVSGTVSYAQIEIEAGGQLSGDVKVFSGETVTGSGAAFAAPPPAASPAPPGNAASATAASFAAGGAAGGQMGNAAGNPGTMARATPAPAPAGAAPHRVTPR